MARLPRVMPSRLETKVPLNGMSAITEEELPVRIQRNVGQAQVPKKWPPPLKRYDFPKPLTDEQFEERKRRAEEIAERFKTEPSGS